MEAAAWKAECHVSKLNTYNPRYQTAYEEFFLAKSNSAEFSGFFKSKESYYKAIAVAHQLQNYNIYDRLAAWSNACVDFLDVRYSISQMHGLSVLIVSSLKKICAKEKVAVILFEALKACVGFLVAYFHDQSINHRHYPSALRFSTPSSHWSYCFFAVI